MCRNSEPVWSFELGRVRITLEVREDYGYQYDGEDEDGETQAKLDNGEFVAFDSIVTVYIDGHEMASDALSGSVYGVDEMSEFWTAHRTSAPEYRNTLAQKAQHQVICHYFPGMVSEAVSEARAELARLQRIPLRAA
ncbi:MAG: hypothetical protein ACJ8FS_16525 [Sphingomicrobium sp.]